MLILKQNSANSVPTPPSGKGTIFLDDSDTLSVKTSDGNIETFPTVAASNSQVVFINGTALSGENAFTYDFNNNVLTVSGNVAAGNLLTDNLLYANGTPWDLQQTGGSNTQVQFNDNGNFGGDSKFTFDKVTGVVAITGNVTAGNVSATLVGGTLTTAAQPNVTSVGTLTSLSVTGNVSAGNISGVDVLTANLISGTLSTAAQPNVTSVGTLTSLDVTGNANVGNIGGNNAVFTSLSGTLTTNAQPNVTSLGTLSVLDVNGNITAANITANTGVFTGNGSGLSAIAGANVTGTVANATHSSTANTVVDNAQPNITSVGTLTSLAVTGNVSAGNVNAGNLLTANFVAGTLTTNSQPNITSVGTLTSLAVDGSNITLANGVFAGNGSGLFSLAGANVTGTVANATHSSTSNTVVDAAQANITSLGTLTGLGVNGDITAANITANTGVFTGNGSGLSAIAGGNVTGQVANALVSGTVYTAAQPNITSVGTLTSLAVTGNVSAGNISTGGVLSVTGNANVGNIGAAAGVFTTVTGSLTTASQPNITSVGTLTSLSVTGNVAAGNLTTTGILSVTGTGVSSIAGNLDMTSNNIINLASPVNDNDAATKLYVDNLVSSGIHYHEPVRLESPVNLNATYNNGSSGVGATLTNAGANAALVIDGVSVNVADRILIYQQTNQVQNGVYVVTTVGDGSTAWVLTRASDADTYSPSTNSGLDEGSYFFVQEGNTGAGESYVCSTIGTITFGTTNITFAQFSASQVYSAGTGLTLANLTFSVNASQTQITALGNVTTGTWNSLVGGSATFAAGLSGANLASITGGNVTGQVANALVSGTVYTAAQPNITSVGTLTSLAVTGNVSAGNIVCTGVIGGAGADLTGNVLTTGSNSTAGVITGDWTLSAGSTLNSTYADLAEKYVADAEYEPGTVLLFGGDHEVTVSHELDSHRVAGVVSTNPAYTMNQNCTAEFTAVVALQGRVPCKVHGPVNKGDLMVSGANGHAIANNMARAGTIVGKALQNFEGSSGVIEVAVGRL